MTCSDRSQREFGLAANGTDRKRSNRLGRRCAWFVIALFMSLGVALSSTAGKANAELIPTPTFSDHEVPTTQVPAGDAAFWDWLNVGLLLLALILASYLALVRRSRRGLLWLSVACLAWFGFVRQGCVCAIGSLQNVTLAFSDPTYLVPVSVLAFFALPLLFTLFFGRTFCAAVCPLGAVQELVAVRSMRVPRWIDHALALFGSRLSRCSGDLRGHGDCVSDLSLRSVCGVLSTEWECQYRRFQRLCSADQCVCGTSLLSLFVSLWCGVGLVITDLEMASENSPKRLHQLSTV
jgi:hypothetical protein